MEARTERTEAMEKNQEENRAEAGDHRRLVPAETQSIAAASGVETFKEDDPHLPKQSQ